MRVSFFSLGCDKNTVDSEKILKKFIKDHDVEVVQDAKDADIAIVNTCSFILDAKKESIDCIKQLVELKKKGHLKEILVLGCLVSENQITHKYDELFNEVTYALSFDKYKNDLDSMNDRVSDILSFSSSIKICDGCDKYCSYCIIPYLKGRFKSNEPQNIIEETKKLSQNGVKELMVVGQDVLHYGIDIRDNNFFNKNEKPIVTLINEISKISGIEWIRLLYCYPEEIDESVIKLIKENKKVLKYIDMPIQHSSDRILKLMNRQTTKESIKNIVKKLKSEIKDICIRTTIIVGFPGETEEDFDDLKSFIKEIEFDKLGVFTYSREKLSKSYYMKNQIDDEIKEERKKIILDIQRSIVKKNNEKKIGLCYKAIVEGKIDAHDNFYLVRPYFNARGIDDCVFVKSKKTLISGSFIDIKIIGAKDYDLYGEIL